MKKRFLEKQKRYWIKMKNNVLSSKISGWGIFAFRKLHTIKLVELRSDEKVNEYYEPERKNISRRFYMNKLNSIGIFDTISGSLNLKHLERINKLIKHYAEFQIYYSLSDESEIKHELLYNQKFDYTLLYYFEDLIDSFNYEKRKILKKSKGSGMYQ
jgi:hypothetical protein